jgi:hypothetical protein
MTTPIFWIEGDRPHTWGWFLVTHLTNDIPPQKAVAYAWFNNDSIEKWWVGLPGCQPLARTITHYAIVPLPT